MAGDFPQLTPDCRVFVACPCPSHGKPRRGSTCIDADGLPFGNATYARWCAELDARIWSAVFTHTYALGFSFQVTIQPRMSRSRPCTLVPSLILRGAPGRGSSNRPSSRVRSRR